MKSIPFHFYNYKWDYLKEERCTIYVCGWAEYENHLLVGSCFIEVINEKILEKREKFNLFLHDLNGNFTIIITDNKRTVIGCDRMRTMPITYFFYNDELVITDDLMRFKKKNEVSFQIDGLACEQYLCSNYVIGPYTILDGVYSIQAGEKVTIDHSNQSIEQEQYFEWKPNMGIDDFKRNVEEDTQKQNDILLNVFKRMLRSAPNVHNWIIPLSGGYDSRTMVNYLYKLGVKNVICYSYGIKENLQTEIARDIATTMGYPFYFIDYKKWMPELYKDNILTDYRQYGFNGSSVSHLQDFPAVYALKEKGILGKGDIFLPGMR